MLNITLTVTAAPELLAAISYITNALTGAKVTMFSQDHKDSAIVNSSKENIVPITYNQPAPTTDTYKEQVLQITQVIENQQSGQPQVSVVPTSVQSYTMEQLAVAATQIVDAGRRTELVNLLQSFGVQALTALPKERYGAFATQLKVMGAKI